MGTISKLTSYSFCKFNFKTIVKSVNSDTRNPMKNIFAKIVVSLFLVSFMFENGFAKDSFEQFRPTTTSSKTFNFDVWSEILNGVVVYTGPSARHRMPRPNARLKIGVGSSSPYRVDGNRVAFSQLDEGWQRALHQYAKELETIANEIDIASLSRNEQLAFWFNLHNATVIDQISQNYPLKYPQRHILEEYELSFHDAKILNISGVPLSLRDIRENIVYENWQNPVVIYGFFLGDMGSPSIQKVAYTGENVQFLLKFGAEEFASSLRGVHRWDEKVRISKLFLDVRRFYFPDFTNDVTAHLRKYSSESLLPDILGTSEFFIMPYPYDVADLAGGSSLKSKDSIKKFSQDLDRKFRTLRRQGKIKRGEVVIEDIPSDVDNDPKR